MPVGQGISEGGGIHRLEAFSWNPIAVNLVIIFFITIPWEPKKAAILLSPRCLSVTSLSLSLPGVWSCPVSPGTFLLTVGGNCRVEAIIACSSSDVVTWLYPVRCRHAMFDSLLGDATVLFLSILGSHLEPWSWSKLFSIFRFGEQMSSFPVLDKNHYPSGH